MPEQPVERGTILVPGHSCWRIEHANRLALIVDAAEYFRIVKAAMLKARHSIILVGWDFDTRIEFEPEGKILEGPNRLGQFLSWLPKQRPDLRIFVLKWDLGMLQALGRGMTPIFILDWITSRRIRFKLDGAHPVGASHHQKIVVIDGALAFCGGIDITAERWDTREHRDDNPLRTTPGGSASLPWHDATTAIDGAASRALWDIASERWTRATGETLPEPPDSSGFDPWPADLKPTIENVDVAIARSLPELDDRQEVREIEALYLGAIAAAKHTIYIETQYLASRTIAEAFAARLREPDGPEVILVLPEKTLGWLEHKAMDGARRKLFHLLWQSDMHKRFGVFYPVTKEGHPIYVHAKIMIVDDMLLRVGSSNLNNRSMGFDTECDLAIEAIEGSADEARLRKDIALIRADLLCEHLAVSDTQLASAMRGASGSLLGAINDLRGKGKTLVAFETSDIEDQDSVLAESELLDPERTADKSATTRLWSGLGKFKSRVWSGGRGQNSRQ